MTNPKTDKEKEKSAEKQKKIQEQKVETHRKPGDSKKTEIKEKTEETKKSAESKPVEESKAIEESKAVIAVGKKKKKRIQKINKGIVHIKSTFNNTIVTITDMEGNTVVSSSSGSVGFKGTKKSTPFAASRAADTAGKKAAAVGMKEISVYVKGPGAGREAAIRSLESAGLSVVFIKDVTPIPHNGCRPPKRRRV